MTLLNLLISSSNFLIVSFGFSIYNIVSSANSESFFSSFLFWILFIFVSSLIAIVRTSKTMLNNSGESVYHCLIPDLTGKAFSFSNLLFNLHEFVFFVVFFLWLIVLQSEKILDTISIFLNLLRLDSWPKLWSILENVPCAIEKKVYSAFGWKVLKISIRSIWSNVS